MALYPLFEFVASCRAAGNSVGEVPNGPIQDVRMSLQDANNTMGETNERTNERIPIEVTISVSLPKRNPINELMKKLHRTAMTGRWSRMHDA